MEKLTEEECRQQMPMAYFLHKVNNDTTNRKTISRMLEVHGQHLLPEHVAAIRSLDKDRVTHFLSNECMQYADVTGEANGLVLIDDTGGSGTGPTYPNMS